MPGSIRRDSSSAEDEDLSTTPRAGAYVDIASASEHHHANGLDIAGGSQVTRRRSSISLGIDRIRYAGGVNSLENFARSWTRAGAFLDPNATPPALSYLTDAEAAAEAGLGYEDSDNEDAMSVTEAPHPPNSRYITPYGSLGSGMGAGITRHGGANYGSVRPQQMFSPEHAAAQTGADDDSVKELEPLITKQIAGEQGTHYEVVLLSKSTLPQTVFNEVNVLIGIGLLSLPLGLKYSGWVLGLGFLAFSALVTNYTAKLLAKCLMKLDRGLGSYGDIAHAAFPRLRSLITVLFSMELMGACVALIVLFADTMHDLLPGVNKLTLKIFAGFILTPLSFLPLKVLSFNSVLGIISCFSIVGIVFMVGLIKTEAPGSLRAPMPTNFYPKDWSAVPLSFGLLMSPWGGHGVFPAIYSDMRHPKKYNKSVDITYGVTSFLDFFMAIIGLLMFGDLVRDEITSNVFNIGGYPDILGIMMAIFIAIIPISKTPLNAQPIIGTLEDVFSVSPVSEAAGHTTPAVARLSRTAIRILCNISFVIIAIIFPSFDRIMALVGSFLCFTICVILPILFYLKIYGDEVPRWEWWMCSVICAVSTVLAGVGTVASLMPRV